MSITARWYTATAPLLLFLLSSACARTERRAQAAPPETLSAPHQASVRRIRVTGVIEAVHSVKITVPMIQGQTSYMTLTGLASNGSQVKEGDVVASFDPAQQMDAARDAQGKFEDLGHQVEQKMAENRSNAEKRVVDLREAEGDLAKAELELEKGEVLGDIDRDLNKETAAGAKARLQSLTKSRAAREKTEAAALRILELQRDRQKIALQRARDNLDKLTVKAPLSGMLVHEMTYRAGSYGRAQIGDQLYRSYPVARIFQTSEMLVRCRVNEPDVVPLLAEGSAAVYLDAYPDDPLPAHFISANPVASTALGTTVKTFVAVFQIDKPDPRLLPDLSAAVVLSLPARGGAK